MKGEGTMSTRCQIAIYSDGEKEMEQWDVLIYRHSDGYPGTADGETYGVLADIVPFLRYWKKSRGISDTEYTGARLLQYLCNKYDESSREFTDDWGVKHPMGVGELGHGICKGVHGDIEYFYRVYPDVVEVYKSRGSYPSAADMREKVVL